MHRNPVLRLSCLLLGERAYSQPAGPGQQRNRSSKSHRDPLRNKGDSYANPPRAAPVPGAESVSIPNRVGGRASPEQALSEAVRTALRRAEFGELDLDPQPDLGQHVVEAGI